MTEPRNPQATFTVPDPQDYDAWVAAELKRGELAFGPETIECYECAGFNGRDFVMQPVVRLGRVVGKADPTQTYVLACGHVAI